MPYLIKAIFLGLLFYFFVGRRFFMLWKGGLIGVGIMVVVDYFGTSLNLYHYQKGIIYLGSLPLLHIINIYAISMLYLNWLPAQWGKRVLYTVYISFLFLTVEALMFSDGGIAYLHWKLWYSYPLTIGGLLVLAHLSDLVAGRETVQ